MAKVMRNTRRNTTNLSTGSDRDARFSARKDRRREPMRSMNLGSRAQTTHTARKTATTMVVVAFERVERRKAIARTGSTSPVTP